jgi:hypothetical protein
MRPGRWVAAGTMMLLGVTTAIMPGQAATAAPAPSDEPLAVYVGTLDAAQL